jgi:FlaA1/EpsC-like NDP-sugar epimerase
MVGEGLKRAGVDFKREVENKKHSRPSIARVGDAHRAPLPTDSGEDMDHWTDKSVLITGVCGTVGQELLKQVVKRGPGEVIGLDNNESELFFLMRE